MERMLKESQALVRTYLEGAGVVAWAESDGRYESMAVRQEDRVSAIDDVLHRVAADINRIAKPGEEPPSPELPPQRAVDVGELRDDEPGEWRAGESRATYRTRGTISG
ncbi:MAG: hypothetical protein IBX62_04195 [Coriobacteriia bacterium]|nr:hypothetical protein [Coriobacteriia bacterium]